MEADIPRVLHRVLLVIVGAEAGNLLETKLLRHRQSRAGRLSVDLDADPSVGQPSAHPKKQAFASSATSDANSSTDFTSG